MDRGTPERYFAFGANLHPATLRRRGVSVERAETARLPRHRLAFDVPGVPLFEPSFASVHPADDEVWGALYELTPRAMARLCAFEGLSYRVVDVTLEVGDARAVEAKTFVARRRGRQRPPSARYLSLIVGGARHHGLPAAWIARLEAQPTRQLPVLHDLWATGFVVADRIHRWMTRPSRRE